jgi:hypothetical protein
MTRAEHICGPWSDCDAECMERSYKEYAAQEAASCEHGVWLTERCADCEDQKLPPDLYYGVHR